MAGLKGKPMHSSDKPLRAAWYSRVSTEQQAEAATIDLQRDYALRFFRLHEGALTLVRAYEDEGVSGSIPLGERPAGGQLLADARNHHFDVIVFYSFDRLVRSTLDLLQLHKSLQEWKVELRSATQPFDTTTPFGRAFMTLLAMVAELEREQIKERTLRGRLRAAREGRAPGGPAPFGYRWTDKVLTINEEEAATVRLIFRKVAEGLSLRALVDWLHAHGIPAATEARGEGLGDWHLSTLSNLIHNPVYRGVYQYNTHRWVDGRPVPRPESEWVTAQAPRIVSDKLWYAAQEAVAINSQKIPTMLPKIYTYLLTGLVHCAICGRSMVGSGGSRRKDGSYMGYYRHPRPLAGKPSCEAGTRYVSAPELERRVWQDVEKFLNHPTTFLELLRQYLQQQVDAPPGEAPPNVQAALEKKMAARTSILRMLARSLIPEEEAEEQLLQLDGEIRELESERDVQAATAFEQAQVEARLLEADQLLAQLRRNADSTTDEGKRLIIQALVADVQLRPGPLPGQTLVDVTYILDPIYGTAF